MCFFFSIKYENYQFSTTLKRLLLVSVRKTVENSKALLFYPRTLDFNWQFSFFFRFDSSQTREVRITTSTQIKSLDVFFNDNSHSLENWLTRKSPHWCSTFNRQNKFNHLLAKTMLLCTQMRMCVCNSSAQCVTTNGGVVILNLRQHILHMRFHLNAIVTLSSWCFQLVLLHLYYLCVCTWQIQRNQISLVA